TAGVPDQEQLAARVRAHGARMIGPNSLGIHSAHGELTLAWGSLSPGPLAIISQSGQVGSEIATLGRRCGVGVSRFVSVGNQVDVTASELLGSLVPDASTTVVAVYLESFAEGRVLIEAMQRLHDAGKT